MYLLFLILQLFPVSPTVFRTTCGCSWSCYRVVLDNKVRPVCVCFDYSSVRTGEAPRPWGDMSIAQLWWGNSIAAAAVCVFVLLRVCVCCDSRGQLLPAPLPWCFPTEKGLISERARGVLENETSDGCWQRPWKCMTANASHSAIGTE